MLVVPSVTYMEEVPKKMVFTEWLGFIMPEGDALPLRIDGMIRLLQPKLMKR
jgi:hypothetical protein